MQAAIITAHISNLKPRSLIEAVSRWKPFWPAAAALFIISITLSLSTQPDVAGPIHVDEWTNLAYAEALLSDGDLPHADPLFEGEPIGFRPETGFRVFLAQLNMVTGMDWERMFPMLPALMMAGFAVTAMALGASLRLGVFAGALAIGAPTTLRFLGPEFAVPVSLGLSLATTLGIVLLANGISEQVRYVISPILMTGLVLVHPPTALVAAIGVAALGGLTLRGETGLRVSREQIPFALTLLVPIIWFAALSGDVRSELLGETSNGQSQGQGQITNYLLSAGYLRVSLMTLSLFFLTARGFTAPKTAFIAGIALTLGFARAHELGIVGMANLYDRSWLYLDLLLIFGGAAGITTAIAMARERKIRFSDHRWMPTVAFITILVISVGGSVVARTSQDVYRIGESERLSDFRWIGENLSNIDGLTLMEPDIAISYPSVAGRQVFASSAFPRPSTPESIDTARNLLDGPTDANTLAELGIGIIYSRGWTESPGITEVRPSVFVVDAAHGFEVGETAQ